MVTAVKAACIYARISSDQDGTALGVQRQVEDCLKLAEGLGWAVVDEYVDNDISAYSGKRRPEYERMLADLQAGTRDAVVIYHPDRLTRQPKELDHFVDVLTAARVSNLRFASGGGLDSATGDGLMVVRIQAAMAAAESATKSRRMKRKMQQKAEAGLPNGGYGRPFGFEDDKVTIRPVEAQLIRDLADRYLAGESLRSLTRWLEEHQVQTARGGQWRSPTLQQMLSSGRIAGLREYESQVVGKAVWQPIINEHTRDRILARMAENKNTGRRPPRRYLLTGLLFCHRCEKRLYSSSRAGGRRYVCSSGPDHGGCGGTMVVAPPVEDLISRGVLHRLDTPMLADALAGRAASDERTAGLADAIRADQEQLVELTSLYSNKDITAREWMDARNPIQARIGQTQAAIARASRSDALAGLVGNGVRLGATWSELNLDRQAAIVRAVLDHAVVGPGKPGPRVFDQERITPVWRL